MPEQLDLSAGTRQILRDLDRNGALSRRSIREHLKTLTSSTTEYYQLRLIDHYITNSIADADNAVLGSNHPLVAAFRGGGRFDLRAGLFPVGFPQALQPPPQVLTSQGNLDDLSSYNGSNGQYIIPPSLQTAQDITPLSPTFRFPHREIDSYVANPRQVHNYSMGSSNIDIVGTYQLSGQGFFTAVSMGKGGIRFLTYNQNYGTEGGSRVVSEIFIPFENQSVPPSQPGGQPQQRLGLIEFARRNGIELTIEGHPSALTAGRTHYDLTTLAGRTAFTNWLVTNRLRGNFSELSSLLQTNQLSYYFNPAPDTKSLKEGRSTFGSEQREKDMAETLGKIASKRPVSFFGLIGGILYKSIVKPAARWTKIISASKLDLKGFFKGAGKFFMGLAMLDVGFSALKLIISGGSSKEWTKFLTHVLPTLAVCCIPGGIFIKGALALGVGLGSGALIDEDRADLGAAGKFFSSFWDSLKRNSSSFFNKVGNGISSFWNNFRIPLGPPLGPPVERFPIA